ncbi:cytochrome C [Sulfurimonas sp.]|uniref:cytochrome C n=1 Tax=Sulfurimonas sp. TaxID=2022749 RepID=UPI002AAF9305|nr:cytochrome C [Sulfurimonas sp.]
MKIIALLILSSIVIFASIYTKADRIKDMQIMEKAMSTISTGILYNNIDIVKDGAMLLSDTIRKVKPPIEVEVEKDPMARYINNRVIFSNKIVRNIDRKVKTILERFRDGDSRAASQAHAKIMKQCIQCHYEVLDW